MLCISRVITKRTFGNTIVKSFSTLYQSGILPEGSTNAYFGTYNVSINNSNDINKVKEATKAYQSIIESFGKQYNDSLFGTISFGKKLWSSLTQDNAGLKDTAKELIDFPGYGRAPATQCDLYIHIHGKDSNAVFDASRKVIEEFGGDKILKLVDEKNGFRWKEGRDLTGFIDGTANPHTVEKRSAAALNSDGSSYVLVQRYVHNLSEWNKNGESEQEKIIGRTKADSKELKPVPADSHVGRTDIKEDGKGLKIVRHSLPYGSAGGEMGLWFTSYCYTIYNIETMLKSMFGLRDDKHDKLMHFSKAVSGGYYFVPSIEMINKL